jgi:hypothetical protein
MTENEALDLYVYYKDGESLSQVAGRCGYSREGVRKVFQRYGLKLRTREESKQIPPTVVEVRR